ncbi:MAG: DUF4124 domain-containing protein [Dokdonella sp.]
MKGFSGGRFGGTATRLAGFALLACGFFHGARAAPVYRCLDAQRHVAYQDHACAQAQQETRVELAPLPSPAPSPNYGRGARESVATRKDRKRASSRAVPHPSMSYECRAGNGEVFYRHSACPKSIRIRAATRGGHQRQTGQTESVAVSGTALPRAEACRRLALSSARAGHERDDQVSTYERNLGRDPCRRY